MNALHTLHERIRERTKSLRLRTMRMIMPRHCSFGLRAAVEYGGSEDPRKQRGRGGSDADPPAALCDAGGD